MSMTYADANPTIAGDRSADEVFVPRYARKRTKSNKPVKTWMIVAPIGAIAVIGTAAALMMGGGETSAPAQPAEAAPAQVQTMQTAPSALDATQNPVMTADTPAAQPAPVEATPVEAAPAPVARRAEPAPRRAAPAAAPVERPAARAEAPAEPTGPRPYSASPVTPSLNTTPAAPSIQTAPAPAPAPAQSQAPAIAVQPLS